MYDRYCSPPQGGNPDIFTSVIGTLFTPSLDIKGSFLKIQKRHRSILSGPATANCSNMMQVINCTEQLHAMYKWDYFIIHMPVYLMNIAEWPWKHPGVHWLWNTELLDRCYPVFLSYSISPISIMWVVTSWGNLCMCSLKSTWNFTDLSGELGYGHLSCITDFFCLSRTIRT